MSVGVNWYPEPAASRGPESPQRGRCPRRLACSQAPPAPARGGPAGCCWGARLQDRVRHAPFPGHAPAPGRLGTEDGVARRVTAPGSVPRLPPEVGWWMETGNPWKIWKPGGGMKHQLDLEVAWRRAGQAAERAGVPAAERDGTLLRGRGVRGACGHPGTHESRISAGGAGPDQSRGGSQAEPESPPGRQRTQNLLGFY